MDMNDSAKKALHELPKDMYSALVSDESAFEHWNDLTSLAQNEWICWVTSTKKPETRQNHIERVAIELMAGKRRPCCWPGCPHR